MMNSSALGAGTYIPIETSINSLLEESFTGSNMDFNASNGATDSNNNGTATSSYDITNKTLPLLDAIPEPLPSCDVTETTEPVPLLYDVKAEPQASGYVDDFNMDIVPSVVNGEEKSLSVT